MYFQTYQRQHMGVWVCFERAPGWEKKGKEVWWGGGGSSLVTERLFLERPCYEHKDVVASPPSQSRLLSNGCDSEGTGQTRVPCHAQRARGNKMVRRDLCPDTHQMSVQGLTLSTRDSSWSQSKHRAAQLHRGSQTTQDLGTTFFISPFFRQGYLCL